MRVVGTAALIAIAVGGSLVASAGRTAHHFTVRRELAHPRAVVVQVSAADVAIAGGRARSATVEARETWAGSQQPTGRIGVTPARSYLLLGSKCADSQHLQLWRFGAHCSVRYTVHTPATNGLAVAMGTGDLTVTGIAGPFSDSTETGDLHASALRSLLVTVHVGVGDAHVSFSRPPSSVTLVVGVGDGSVLLPRGHYDIDARASVGDVRIGAGIVQDPTSLRKITVSSNVGDVHVDADD
jgi:hypothetical protein